MDGQIFNDAQQATGFITPSVYRMHGIVLETKYPQFNYAEMIPTNVEGDMWDIGTLIYSGDYAGAMDYVSGKGFDIPSASANMAQGTSNFHLAGLGYDLSLQEVNRASKANINIDSRKAMGARKGAEQFIYDVAMRGKAEKGITGIINNPLVPAANAINGTWGAATPDELLADVNQALTDVYTATNETELANALLLPTTAFLQISNRRLTDVGVSVLTYLQNNNSYTAISGQPLSIMPSRELEKAGASNSRRMVAYAKTPDVLEFFLPGMFEFLAPHAKSAMSWRVDGIANVGQLEIYRPNGVSYRDGI